MNNRPSPDVTGSSQHRAMHILHADDRRHYVRLAVLVGRLQRELMADGKAHIAGLFSAEVDLLLGRPYLRTSALKAEDFEDFITGIVRAHAAGILDDEPTNAEIAHVEGNAETVKGGWWKRWRSSLWRRLST